MRARASVARAAVALAALSLLVACGGPDDAANPSATLSGAASTPKSAAVVAAESLAQARDQWNKAEVIRRLAEAGLVVTDSGRGVRHQPLSVEGELLGVSGGELALFVYEDAAARTRDAAALDTSSAGGSRFIVVNNLVARLRTSREQLAERVTDVLTARHAGAVP